MDAQCSCIWRAVNSSVKRTARRSFVSQPAKKDTEQESLS